MRLAFVMLLLFPMHPLWGQETETVPPAENIENLAISGTHARLRGLDTMTGSTQDFDIEVGGPASRFGRLSIDVSACRYFAENPATQSYAFITVKEMSKSLPVFSAWMIAASPALSAMDHPRYDIWLINCRTETDLNTEI